jgi:hypothetical protein
MPHIENLYKCQDILMFRECFALEKVHGTNSKIAWKQNPSNPSQYQLVFSSGGTKHELFVSLFNKDVLTEAFKNMGITDRDIIVFGESYGGKEQGMSETYGKLNKFIVFDVKIGENWLDVPKADEFAKSLGLEFVHYRKISTDLAAIDAERDADSEQAIRNGVGPGKQREGVVLRPLIELTKNNGDRIISKHKRDEFRETKTPRPVVDPAKMQILADAEAVANEWVTPMRLQHVLDKIPGHCMEKMRAIIAAMVEDVLREGSAEIIDSDPVRKALGKATALAYKAHLKSKLHETAV